MRNLALGSLVVLSGCLYNDPGPGGGGPVEPDLLGDGFATALCAKMFECCDTIELQQQFGGGTEDDCRDQYAQTFSMLLEPVLLDSIDSDRVTYDADIAGDCIAAYRDLSCAEFAAVRFADGPFEGCSSPFDPQVANDAACGNDYDCTSGYCSGDSVDFQGTITYGTCITAPGLDDPCDGSDCGDGFYCNFSTFTCASPLANGTNCGSDTECDSGYCDDSTFVCADATICDGV